MVQHASRRNALGAPLRNRLRRRDRRLADRNCGNKTLPESTDGPMKPYDYITHDIKWLEQPSRAAVQAKPRLSQRHRHSLAAARREKDREFGIKLLVKCQPPSAQAFAFRSPINPSCMQLSHRP